MRGMVERSRVGGGAGGVGENVSVPHVECEHFSQNIYFNAWCFTSTETIQLSRDDEAGGRGRGWGCEWRGLEGKGGRGEGGEWRGLEGKGGRGRGANGGAWRGEGRGMRSK